MAACLAVAGCSEPIRQFTPSTSPSPSVAPTDLASLFLTSDEVKAATGLTAVGDPVTEGQPDKRGGDLPFPCAQMAAGPRDTTVIGTGYLGYRSIKSASTDESPRYIQTIALYPSEGDAKGVIDRLAIKLDECRAAPDRGDAVTSMKSSATRVQWAYKASTPGLCGFDVGRAANVVVAAEICHTGDDLNNASKVVEGISAKIRVA
nr:sensor domain-containing protein [Mycobacteroides abscessus]